MIIAAQYSFNCGKEEVTKRFPKLLLEVSEAIQSIDAEKHRKKQSKEKTKMGKLLYSPISINRAFKAELGKVGWKSARVTCDYETTYYEPGYKPKKLNSVAFRKIDFVKNKLGIEVQLGKYSFMVYNVAAKMTIFRNFRLYRMRN